LASFDPAQTNLGNGFTSADFATINKDDSGTQLTCKGWLYYFSGDSTAAVLNVETLQDGGSLRSLTRSL
jgi:hypothetical protein